MTRRMMPIYLEERPPSSRDGAVCAQIDPDIWFPEKGGDVQKPKQFCNGRPAEAGKRAIDPCPLRVACLEWSLKAREPFGIWGGLTAIEREHVLRSRGERGFS